MSGFFAGGMAEGMNNAAELGIKRDTLAQESGLRTRALDIQEQGQKNAMQRDLLTRVDTQIDATMGIVGETIKAGVAAGKDPVIIQKAVSGLVESAKNLAQRVGRDPGALDSQVIAQLVHPTTVEAKTAEGAGSAAKTIAEDAGLIAAGVDPNRFNKPEHKDRVAAEGALRDDYIKNATPYITIRDAKNRMDSLSDTGAGDIALVFNYMKILDPSSTVREGEFAQAAQSGGLPSHLQAVWNKLSGEGVLAEKTRKEIRAEASKIFQAQAEQHDKLTTRFAGIAKRQGMNVNNVIVDLLPTPTFDKMPDVETAIKAGKVQVGDTIIFQGRRVKVEK